MLGWERKARKTGDGIQGNWSERFCLHGASATGLQKRLLNLCLHPKSDGFHDGASEAEGTAQ